MRNNVIAKKLLLILSFLLPGSTLLILPYSVSDPINLPKMVFLIVCSGVMGGILFSSFKEIAQPGYRQILILLSLFCFNLFILLFVFRDAYGEIFYGVPGRNTGVLTYLAFLIVLLACA